MASPLTTTLSRVEVAPRRLSDYRGVAVDALLDEVVALAADLRARYLEHNRHCAAMLGDDWDVVVVHDPQPRPSTTQSERRQPASPTATC